MLAHISINQVRRHTENEGDLPLRNRKEKGKKGEEKRQKSNNVRFLQAFDIIVNLKFQQSQGALTPKSWFPTNGIYSLYLTFLVRGPHNIILVPPLQ